MANVSQVHVVSSRITSIKIHVNYDSNRVESNPVLPSDTSNDASTVGVACGTPSSFAACPNTRGDMDGGDAMVTGGNRLCVDPSIGGSTMP